MKPTGVGANKALAWKLKVPARRKRGTYRFYVYAKDIPGNTQANVASARLVVT